MYDELIMGNRGWGLADNGDGFVLESTYAPDIWTGDVMTSDCRCEDSYYRFIVPQESMFNGVHSCGLVALKPGCNLINGVVFGTIAMFGKIQEFEFGYRAEHAFISSLFQDEARCDTCWTDLYTDEDQSKNPYLFTPDDSISRATMVGQRLGEWRSLYCDYHAAERSPNEFLYYYPEILRSLSLTYNVPLILRETNHE